MFAKNALSLLAELEANNRKDWFDAHRDEIKREVQGPFRLVLELVSDRLAAAGVGLRGGEAMMFRMNRDVRFSKDKSPYKPSVSGLLTPSGTKAEAGGLVYLHLDKQGGFVAGGFHQLDTKALGPIRDRIIEDPDAFRGMLDHLGESGLSLSFDDQLASMPRGYAQHDGAWYAPHLRLKSFIVQRHLDPTVWISGSVVDLVADFAKGTIPLIEFGDQTSG